MPAATLLEGRVTASGRHRAHEAAGEIPADTTGGTGSHRRTAPPPTTTTTTGAAAAGSPTGGVVAGSPAAGDRTAAADPSPWAPRHGGSGLPLSGVELFGGAEAAPATGTGGTAAVPAPRTEITGGAIAGLHEKDTELSGTGSVVVVDRGAAPRSRVRRFAPLGIGAAAVMAAAMVLTLLQPGTEDPSLSAALVNDSSRRSSSDTALTAGPVLANGGGSALGDAAQGASGQIGQALAAQEAAERRAEERRRAAAERARTAGSAGSSDAGSAGPVAGAVQVAGEGVQAALKMGWQAIGGDEFLGSALGGGWSAYDGPGHDGQGRRTPDAITVENGNLVIRGDSQGNTGGMAWGTPQKYGKWEMRAQFPKGDKQYHPVLLLWPSEVSWPEGGEIDFAETNSAADDVSFFLHYGSSNSQKDAKKQIDITQWHNYAVEWTPDAIVGYIDGVEWFRSTDPQTLPPGPMHATIQLDYFPDGGSPEPSEMRVAWMRQYK
ncbi:glycoside hydrolase family 16 protein [Pseudonocardia spirodelae]|uniref:Glycoside hydrolase family 16 protein n=1 Tax=Pseudonocardia spirodelae TaxID=3133431 RepID=A0ABU8T4A9_9PSEU